MTINAIHARIDRRIECLITRAKCLLPVQKSGLMVELPQTFCTTEGGANAIILPSNRRGVSCLRWVRRIGVFHHRAGVVAVDLDCHKSDQVRNLGAGIGDYGHWIWKLTGV